MISRAALAVALALQAVAMPAAAQQAEVPEMPALDAAPAAPAASPADAATLADLRGQLQQLTGELQGLRAELVASGAAGFQAAGGDSAIDRMNAMEAQLSKLTGQTEQLQHEIQRVVRDGTRRIGDIEFRLCEMDAACDLGALMTQPDLGSQGGGGAGVSIGTRPQPPAAPEESGAKRPTSAEQQDFDRAQEVLGQGDFLRAAELFAAVAQTHAGGPLTAESLFMRGQALDSAGQAEGAAAAWLEAFAADPDGARSSESLLGIARIVSETDDPLTACLYLSEIPVRFAGTDAATEAERRMAALDCGAGELPEAVAEPDAAADMPEDG